MTGPEHYTRAEELVRGGQFYEAQVHAILALVAATAHTIRRSGEYGKPEAQVPPTDQSWITMDDGKR